MLLKTGDSSNKSKHNLYIVVVMKSTQEYLRRYLWRNVQGYYLMLIVIVCPVKYMRGIWVVKLFFSSFQYLFEFEDKWGRWFRPWFQLIHRQSGYYVKEMCYKGAHHGEMFAVCMFNWPFQRKMCETNWKRTHTWKYSD